MRDRLAEDAAQEGFLLDGFPRNVRRPRREERLLRVGGRLSVCSSSMVDEDEVVGRLSGRRTCAAASGGGGGRGVQHALYDPPAARALRRLGRRALPAPGRRLRGRPSGTGSRSKPADLPVIAFYADEKH